MDVVETERKYELDLQQNLPNLAEALDSSVHIERPPSFRLEATYFDTDDHRLLRAGMTLRKRLGGSDEGWHLKVPSGTRWTRTEIREPLGDPQSSEVPAALTDLVLATTRGRSLRPVAEVHTERTIERVIDDSGALMIEVADDLVRAGAIADGPLRTWRELEVEVGPGGERTAKKIDRFLRSEGIKESIESSKLATALEFADRDETPCRPSNLGGALKVIIRGLSAQVEEFAARDLDLRRGVDDAVHDMRVASRRLRSCLRVFAPSLGPEDSDGIQGELRWIGGVLGDARDGEVLRSRLKERAKAQLSDDDSSLVLPIFDSYFSDELARASSALDAALRSDRYFLLLDALERLVDRLSRREGPEITKKEVLKDILREVKRILRRLDEGGKSAGDQRDVLLHKARKAAKRARYAAEMAQPLATQSAAEVVERCEWVQELLGRRQDGVLAIALLTKLAHSHGRADDLETGLSASFALGILEGVEVAEKSRIDEHIDDIEEKLSMVHF